MRILDFDEGNSRSLNDLDFAEFESNTRKRKKRRGPLEWWDEGFVPRRIRKATRRRSRRGRIDHAA